MVLNRYSMIRPILSFFILLLCGIIPSHPATAQIIQDPTTWRYEVKKTGDNSYQLIFHLELKAHWHIWSLEPGGDGLQMPPEFSFEENATLTLSGGIKEQGKKISGEMEGVDGIVSYYADKVTYIQPVTVAANTVITGEHSYQVCDDKQCLPPKTIPFRFAIQDVPPTAMTTLPVDSPAQAALPDTTTVMASSPVITATDNAASHTQQRSLLWLFLMAFAGGIAAVLTPCVYAMIPITVSFFTKRSKTRVEGIRNASWYSLSIILIFTILGVLISVLFGANALNNLSTNWIANLFFFVVFIIFGISFLGAFEISLPTSWTSKTDAKAGIGSFGGIFFMALTLVIVSFSCTGPIIGPLLVLAGQGGIAGPALGMFGFSVGLALPFALFAIFPGMLNKMATSGGWLNQVKVVLGFLELMLALKFLSNADLAMGWRLLDREIFIAIWIVLAVLLGFYLLGKLKLSHDDASPKNVYGQEFVSISRLFLAIVSFTFAVYLLPGMWGAPLNGMSQFLPPMGTQEFVMGKSGGEHTEATADTDGPVKYVQEMKIYEPPVVVQSGLVTYFDYDEALAAARKKNKPLMLDFTGINCVNCRKMESQVWSNPEVMKRLKNDFVIASLYCDYDKIKLPEEEQFFSKELNAQIRTLGDWNEHLQASRFNANAQPFYFFIDGDGNSLTDQGYGYDPNVDRFVRHLDQVKERFAGKHGSN